jgi:PIN domain nuclease of toxin-antitoxin system
VIVLDTHAWVWWVDDHPRLNRSVRDRIDAEDDVRVCAISLLEIATAVGLGRLTLRPSAEHWLQIAQTAEQIHIEPLSDTLCLQSTTLPGTFHRDPADRLIVALARKLNVALVTADHKMLAYPHVKTPAAES